MTANWHDYPVVGVGEVRRNRSDFSPSPNNLSCQNAAAKEEPSGFSDSEASAAAADQMRDRFRQKFSCVGQVCIKNNSQAEAEIYKEQWWSWMLKHHY